MNSASASNDCDRCWKHLSFAACACGPDELSQLQSFTEYLEQAGAGHVASILSALHSQIEKDERASARKLLEAQISVRLLERLLTLRVVGTHLKTTVALLDREESPESTEDE